jgi:hypothetical protein
MSATTSYQHHAKTRVNASAAQLLQVLSTPEMVRRWFPVPCTFDSNPQTLQAGGSYPVTGHLAGKTVACTLDVHACNEHEVQFTLTGSLIVDLCATIDAQDSHCLTEVFAGVRSGGGIKGKLMASAATALIKGGALGKALSDIRHEAENIS